MNISVKELPEFEVAYIRHLGSYLDTNDAWAKLTQWAATHNLFPPSHSFIGISLDNPDLVEESSCRYDACVTIPQGFEKERHTEIQFKQLPGGLYVCYPFYDDKRKAGDCFSTCFWGLVADEWVCGR